MLYLKKKKIKKNTCRYHYQNLDDVIYSSWDLKQNILKLVILGHFFPFYPRKKPQNKKFWKMKKLLQILSFYTCAPKIIMIWCMVLKIWRATDIIFCHSGPFFALLAPYGPKKLKFWKNERSTWRYYHFTNVYHKWQSYDVWFLRYRVQRTKLFVILDHFLTVFCSFTPLTTRKIKILKKWKKKV